MQRGSFTDTEYTNFKDDIKIHLTDCEYKNINWTVKQNVPIYDDEGHEYFYKIVETTSLPNYYRTYSYDKENKVYKVKNTYSSEPVHYIKIQKEWQNDGELEYKKALNVHADSSVKSEYTNGQTVVVNEQNVWYNEVYRDQNYVFDTNDFSENADNRNNSTYLNLNVINTDNRVPSTVTENGKKWIYLFDQTCDATVGGNVIDVKELIGNNNVFFDNDHFAGIYKEDNAHYYAVEMYYTPPETTNNPNQSTSGYLKIVNTRIGIVNFKVNFDWQVGTWRHGNENAEVELRITGTVGNNEVVSYTTKVNVGQDTSNNPNELQEYYFKNLPKYDSCGRVINYKLEEIKINGQNIQTNADDEQYFMLKDKTTDADSDANRCVVTITEEDYTQGTDANSNDLVTYTIKNQFSDDIADFTINKRWADNHNRYKTRPDIYICMHRIAIGDENAVDETIDYRWTPSSGEITHEGKYDIWTYHFDKLTKYDEYGRRYLYYVEELPIADKYETSYEQKQNPTAGERRLWDLIHVDTNEYAFDDGTITNRLKGTVVIHGSKLWEKIDPRFANDKTYYMLIS